jgi:poly-gamma-glutamate capsule biosynthesis protein CapA/YwtB (metallophosphatase superfamily)
MIFFVTGHGASVQQGLDVIARQGRFVVFSVFNGDVSADWSLIGKLKRFKREFFQLFFS